MPPPSNSERCARVAGLLCALLPFAVGAPLSEGAVRHLAGWSRTAGACGAAERGQPWDRELKC